MQTLQNSADFINTGYRCIVLVPRTPEFNSGR